MLDARGSAETNPLVVVDQVGKRYGDQEILKGVSLTVRKGDIVSLIGPSGSGKTTLLRCINYLETYESGLIYIEGESVGIRIDKEGRRLRRPDREIAALRAQVGMVFQNYNLFPHLSVLDNITVSPKRVRGLSEQAAGVLAMNLLERVGLGHKKDEYPGALSGGQQQRVAIARALAMQPKLLLLDEVTSALDPELVGEVLDVIRSVAVDGMTMMIVTHEMQFARDVSTSIVFMADGLVVETGPPTEIFNAPKQERLRGFLNRYHAAYRI